MVDIDEMIIREKEVLSQMLLDTGYELNNPDVLAQSSKLDGLISTYLKAGMDYVAATKAGED